MEYIRPALQFGNRVNIFTRRFRAGNSLCASEKITRTRVTRSLLLYLLAEISPPRNLQSTSRVDQKAVLQVSSRKSIESIVDPSIHPSSWSSSSASDDLVATRISGVGPNSVGVSAAPGADYLARRFEARRGARSLARAGSPEMGIRWALPALLRLHPRTSRHGPPY